MGNKIDAAIRDFSGLYMKFIKTIEVEQGQYIQNYGRLNKKVLKALNATEYMKTLNMKKYNCTLSLEDDKSLEKGYYQQTWKICNGYDLKTFTLFINLNDHYVCLNTNDVGPANEPEEEHSVPEPAKETKEEQSKVPEFAQLCITNYERLQKLSILEIAEELISTIHIKDEDGLTRRKYVVLNGDVCNSLSDAIKKNLEWLNDESV